MVALLRLLQLVQIIVEVLLGEERRAVDALELRILLVAQPVRSCNVEQLERLDAAGRRNVWPAAKVGELAGLVNRDLLIGLGELLDEVTLHEVAFRLEALQSFLTRQKLARVRQVLLRQLLHLLLDGFEIFRREGLLAIEVVEESALGRRAMAKLGLGKKFKHCRRHQVRGRVAIDFQRLGIALGKNAQLGIALQRTRKIDQLSVAGIRLGTRCRRSRACIACRLAAIAVRRHRLYLRDQCRIGQTRADALGNFQRGGPSGNIFYAAIRQLHMNRFRHKGLTFSVLRFSSDSGLAENPRGRL